ncbi:MAG: glutamate--cysteine ligase [Legionellales bacterium RIFCSPHIGHO2_12_FULL_37_14]|nr:MAG: glutamate--cysteine ligase [Legionellales bacterium RIFCSPHIGHO2_12_FULL_37_14]
MHNYPIFSVIGIEIEYMLVQQDTLEISPLADQVLTQIAGELVNEAPLGEIAVSNELVMHVLELKNITPQAPSTHLILKFQEALANLKSYLAPQNLTLLPTAAHPWMDPNAETKRWPHDNHDIYSTYDQIFNCKGHGWSNLQSMHVNLPFANDTEFNLLHNTSRLLLPLLPALAASSPILEGKQTKYLDARLAYYNQNQIRIPQISGDIVPEFIASEAEYTAKILQPMYEAIRPFDPNNHLQYEWLNSRGAIPKFDMGAIEIRLIDTQECIHADTAIAFTVFNVLKNWAATLDLSKSYPTTKLKDLYLKTLKQGLNTRVEDKELLNIWQLPAKLNTVRDVWSFLIEQHASQLDPQSQNSLEIILNEGNLSERILKSTGKEPTKKVLFNVYKDLSDCLFDNKMYLPREHS